MSAADDSSADSSRIEPPPEPETDLAAYARALVATWPPLTERQREQLALLLRRR